MLLFVHAVQFGPLAVDAWLVRAGFVAHTFRCHTFASQSGRVVKPFGRCDSSWVFLQRSYESAGACQRVCVFLTLRRLLFDCLHPHFEPVFRCSRRGMRDADFGWFVAEAFAKQLYGSRIGGNTLLGLLLSSCISQCGSFVRQDTRLPNSKSWLHVYMIRKVSSCWEEGLIG